MKNKQLGCSQCIYAVILGNSLIQKLVLPCHKLFAMQTGLLHLHNMLRWVILILLVVSLYKAFMGWTAKKTFQAADKKIWLFTMISAHITLLLGIYQLAFGRYGMLTTKIPDGSNVMKDAFFRFFWIEHPLTMIISVLLITLAHGVHKKNISATAKYKKAFYFLLIALVLILAGIPWPFREIIGRPIFPGITS